MDTITAIATTIGEAIKLLSLYLKTSTQRRMKAAIRAGRNYILYQEQLDKETDPKKIKVLKARRNKEKRRFRAYSI